MPFWFYTYLSFAILTVFAPMQGRDGPTSKPEILISLFVALFALHFAGFIVSIFPTGYSSAIKWSTLHVSLQLPILHKFSKSRCLSSVFAVICIVFIIIAATPAGFPYKKDVAAQRFYVLVMSRFPNACRSADLNG